MNKNKLIDLIDNVIPTDNQINIKLSLPQAKEEDSVSSSDEYQVLLKDLILLALPSPSQHVH